MSHFQREALRARYTATSKSNLGAVFADVHPDFELQTADRVPGAGTYRGAAPRPGSSRILWSPSRK